MYMNKRNYDEIMRLTSRISTEIWGFNNEENYADGVIPVADVTQVLVGLQERLFDVVWDIANTKEP